MNNATILTTALARIKDNKQALSLLTSKNTLNDVIACIDKHLSESLNQIMHHPDFLQLESSWIGVNQLLKLATDGSNINIRLCSVSKQMLYQETTKQQRLSDSHLFNLIYKKEFNMPGGTPYGIIIGDYHFDHQLQNIAILNMMGSICQKAFCPFISSVNSKLLGFSEWREIHARQGLLNSYKGSDHIEWRQLRESSKSQFIYLTAADYLGRYRYHSTSSDYEFQFEEKITNSKDYCWINSAYAQAQCIIRSFKESGWCTAIRGYETGGKIANLPLTSTLSATQTAFSDDQEYALSQLGVIPLCQYINTNYAVIFGCQSLHIAQVYDDPQATQNAQIAARLPYTLATSRFAHYIKIIARDKIGSFMETQEIEQWLNQWIARYVNANAKSKQALKSRFPLAAAMIEVESDPKVPGKYHAIAKLKPWLQFESLTASLRLITELPQQRQ